MPGAYKPKKGTKAYAALQLLHNVGQAGLIDWWRVSQLPVSMTDFNSDVVGRLLSLGYVTLVGTDYKATPAGAKLLGVAVAAPAAPAATVGPSYKVGIKPLDLARHYPQRLVREGSMDYRDIPSVMGTERVPHAPVGAAQR